MPASLFFVLLITGLSLIVAATVMLAIQAFRENLWWGLSVLFVPPVLLLFATLHWKKTKIGVAIYLVGTLMLVPLFFI